MRELYNGILKCINKIDFKELWEGFHPYRFALYTKTKICFESEEIPWVNAFCGNTAIYYHGEYIAIWKVEEPFDSLDLDILCASIIHEMFHAYQYSHQETRFPDDLKTLLYPQDALNFEYKYEENKLLSNAFQTDSVIEKRQLLDKFFHIRSIREQRIGDFIDCEYSTETVEGMAVFIQCRALRQLSMEKYKTEMNAYVKHIVAEGTIQFDVRHISYYVGAILLLVAEEIGVLSYHEIGKTELTISKMLATGCKTVDIKSISNPWVSSKLCEVLVMRYSQIKDAEKMCTNYTTGRFFISGYDPMNMIRYGDLILCNHFVALTDLDSNERKTFYGKTVLFMEQGSRNIVCSYRTGISE